MNNKSKPSTKPIERKQREFSNYERRGYQPTTDTRPIQIPKGGSGNSRPK
ncbi:hypothetical protein [Clostridium botulinum]|nr:hypothetical protein [Clostridium botulinum]MCD3202869.1 hypothetical protein [Clostridium botulinum C/D]MCD3230844.1 hypothetical protein [Clostridium botulinum C/D]MCD3253971.1 hypothetical protein [Clostridium botulinum C/D]MCD3279433.1 hypothetical protein [Clostridium botulinum C/D]MCD3281588.1 hypothetical protein [Clostridium botulinum C/D]